MFGSNPSDLCGSSWTVSPPTNEEVQAVKQDPLGSHGKRVVQEGTVEV